MPFSVFLKRAFLLLVIGLLLSACGLRTVTPSPPGQPTPTPQAQPSRATTTQAVSPKTTLVPPSPVPPTVTPSPTPLPEPQGEIVLWEQLPPEQQPFLKGKIEAFQKLFPAVQFSLRHLDSDTFSPQLAEAGQNGPHLLIAPAEKAGEWQKARFILPVGALFDKTFLNGFAPNLPSGLQIDSDLWGIPYSFGSSLLLFYNKRLISPDKIPDSWEAMTNFVRANPVKRGEYYPFATDLYDPYLLLAALDAYGGSVLDQKNQPTLNTEAMRQALQFLQDAVFKNKLVPLDPNYPQMQLLFRTGQLAMIIGQSDNLTDYQSGNWNKLELGVARLPRLNSKALRSPEAGLAYFIGSTATGDGAKVAALRTFIRFMSSSEQQRDFLIQLKQFPVTRAGLNDPLVKNDPIFSIIAEQFQASRAIPPLPEWQTIIEAMRSPISAVIASRASPTEGAEAMQDLAQKNLKK